MVDAWQILNGRTNTGSRVIIADWRCDWVGLGIAELLARNGCQVRLFVNGIVAGQSIPQYTRDKWLGDLHRLGIDIITHARLYGIDGENAYFQHTLSGESIVVDGVDTLVTASGHKSNNNLELIFDDFQENLYMVGDCLSPRTVEEAVLEGLRVGACL